MNKEVSGISREWFDLVSEYKKTQETFRKLVDMLEPGDLCYVNDMSVHSGEAVTVVRIEKFSVLSSVPVLVWVPGSSGDKWFSPYELLKVELDDQKPRCYASVRTHPKSSKDPQFIWNQTVAPIITAHYVPTLIVKLPKKPNKP